jgi:O-methyltransferase
MKRDLQRIGRGTSSQGRALEVRLRYAYVKWIRPHLSRDLDKQRIKLLFFGWGYAPLLFARPLSLLKRMRLVARFLKIDWNVPHSHRPSEIADVSRLLLDSAAEKGEGIVEAGCWRGGGSAKLSILCQALGLKLHIYDSFLGVHKVSADEGREYDFSGEYAASEDAVGQMLTHYGESEVCEMCKGWFSDTLGSKPVGFPVRAVYIDCDSAEGTWEVLKGVVPNLVRNGLLISQDMQVPAVKQLLSDPDTWQKLGRSTPRLLRRNGNTAAYELD